MRSNKFHSKLSAATIGCLFFSLIIMIITLSWWLKSTTKPPHLAAESERQSRPSLAAPSDYSDSLINSDAVSSDDITLLTPNSKIAEDQHGTSDHSVTVPSNTTSLAKMGLNSSDTQRDERSEQNHWVKQREKNQEELSQPPIDPSSQTHSTEYLSDLLNKEKPCFKIHTIEMIGEYAHTFSTALDAIYTKEKGVRVNPLNHCIGGKAINLIMRKVQNRIISAGYVTTRIVAEPQDLNAGVLYLTVIPGVINEILLDVKEDSMFIPAQWNSMPMREGELLNLRQIEQAIENYKRVPSVDIDIKIVPTQGAQAKPGRSDLLVVWRQKKRLRGHVSADNSGSKNTGIYQAGFSVSLDNFLGMSDILSVTTSSDLGGGNAGEKGNKNQSIQYSIPFDSRLVTFSTNRYNYHQTVRGSTQDYIYSGESRSKKLTVSQMLHRNARSKTKLDLNFWKRESNNFVNNTEINLQKQDMSGYDLSIRHSVEAGAAHIKGSVTFHEGTKKLSTAPKDLPDIGASYSKYYTAALQIRHPIKLFDKHTLYQLALNGQWNNTPLVSQDRFSIGSRYSVRGYSGERTLSAEQGLTARNELVFPVNQQQVYLAADYGKVDGPSSEQLVGQHLSGWGLGMRGQKNNVNYDMFLGFPLDYPDRFKPDSKMFAINVGMSF